MRAVAEVNSTNELTKTINELKQKRELFFIVGNGTNIIASDSGFDGTIIKITNNHIKISGNKISCGAGLLLQKLINAANKAGLAGLETLAGIPGTVGGAIFGNAGAYGREISDSLVKVKIFNGKDLRWLSKKDCAFRYRESIFKKKPSWVILETKFVLKNGSNFDLIKKSKEIIALREKKYKPNIRCAGSIFKNILAASPAGRRLKNKIPPDKIIKGKIPAGYLLEQVGAKGMRIGGISVANHHGNLIVNNGRGTAKDAKTLIEVLKNKVKNHYGTELEEEVQYLGF